MNQLEIFECAVKGDLRSIGKLLSLIESHQATTELLEVISKAQLKSAKVYGFTGPPGAGKSTLVEKFALNLLTASTDKIAVLAVDPSSPFTGGAVLGDRIRMMNVAENKNIFIRSVASRGALGGLADAVPELVEVFKALNYSKIIIETVGVGQGEVEAVREVDCLMVVLVPGLGDEVQAMKAGILEVADIFVINKSDYNLADRLERDLFSLCELIPEGHLIPKIIRTVASESRGVEELRVAVDNFIELNPEVYLKRRSDLYQIRFKRELQRLISKKIDNLKQDVNFSPVVEARKEALRILK